MNIVSDGYGTTVLLTYNCGSVAASIEWFVEDQAFSRSYNSGKFRLLAHYLPHPSRKQVVSDFLFGAGQDFWREWGRGRGRSQIIRRRESLALIKSFNTLWPVVMFMNFQIMSLQRGRCHYSALIFLAFLFTRSTLPLLEDEDKLN
jgi:hypothetical protein